VEGFQNAIKQRLPVKAFVIQRLLLVVIEVHVTRALGLD
jgi:hypothetical protein